MDTKTLYKILAETTVQLRKGEVFEGTPELVAQARSGAKELKGGGVLHVYAMPSVSEAPDTLVKIDVEFMVIGVDKEKAEAAKADLIKILKTYPQPEQLAAGPSYIAVGAEIGDQGAAFQLFALGAVLGLWEIITPKTLGLEGAEAREAAGHGFVMITGWIPEKKAM